MAIEYPYYFFHLVRPIRVREKLKAAAMEPKTLEAVGVEDPKMIIEYVRDHTEDDDVWMAACKLFPLPGQHGKSTVSAITCGILTNLNTELFGFHFEPGIASTAYLVTSEGIYDVGRAERNLDNDRGALTWVRTYRQMVNDWCAEHRARRLSAEGGL
jgi:hypothetical protein